MAHIQDKNWANYWSTGTVNRAICGLAALSPQESNFVWLYTVQTFQYIYIWLNLIWNNCITLKSGGGGTHTLALRQKMWGPRPLGPPLPTPLKFKWQPFLRRVKEAWCRRLNNFVITSWLFILQLNFKNNKQYFVWCTGRWRRWRKQNSEQD